MDAIKHRYDNIASTRVSVKACVAEMIGTGLFVLAGLLSVVYSNQEDLPLTNSYVTGFAVAFTFGIAITCMVSLTAHSSGGQLNPAITCGAVTSGVTTPVQGVANIISQCIGTILSAAFVMAMVPEGVREGLDLGINTLPDGSSTGRAFLAEVIGMFMIVLTVLETSDHPNSAVKNNAPLAIGLTFVIVILAFGGVSGGGFNPARSFGPAVVSGNTTHLWVYIFGPVTGGVLAGLIHLLSVSGLDTPTDKSIPTAAAYKEKAEGNQDIATAVAHKEKAEGNQVGVGPQK